MQSCHGMQCMAAMRRQPQPGVAPAPRKAGAGAVHQDATACSQATCPLFSMSQCAGCRCEAQALSALRCIQAGATVRLPALALRAAPRCGAPVARVIFAYEDISAELLNS